MSNEIQKDLRERRDTLKGYLPFIRELAVRVKNSPFEDKLKKVAEIIETGNLNANKVAMLEKTINNLRDKLPSRPAPVPIPIVKHEISSTTETTAPAPLDSCSNTTKPLHSSTPNSKLTSIVKKEPSVDPKHRQNHIETDNDDSSDEEKKNEKFKRTTGRTPGSHNKQGRPPMVTKNQAEVVNSEIRPEPQEKKRKLDDKVLQTASLQKKTALKPVAEAVKKVGTTIKPVPEVLKPVSNVLKLVATISKPTTSTAQPAESPKKIHPVDRRTYLPAKPKAQIGPLKTKISTNSIGPPSTERIEVVSTVQEQPVVVSSSTTNHDHDNTDVDDNKLNELKNLLKNIAQGDAKDPKLLDTFEKILGKESFVKVKLLFTENCTNSHNENAMKETLKSPVHEKVAETLKSPVHEKVAETSKSPVHENVAETQPKTPTSRSKRSDSPLKIPPVTNVTPRQKGKKKSEVDKLNEDIMECFIRDGVLKASGLRIIKKVKYEEVVGLEDYELDGGSCSDTDVDEPAETVVPAKHCDEADLKNEEMSERLSVISFAQSSTSHTSTPEPLPETKPCFIFAKQVELDFDKSEYRLLSGITRKFELCEELKPAFSGSNNQLQTTTDSVTIDSDDFGPMEIITIEDDIFPISKQTETHAPAADGNFEIITIDDDETLPPNDRTILKNTTEHRPSDIITIDDEEDVAKPLVSEDLIYNQVRELPVMPVIPVALPSKMVFHQENVVMNLSFVESRSGIFMRCRSEGCYYEHSDQSLFKYHIQSRHALAKWDGSCKMCKKSVADYGHLLDECNHMETCHIMKLKTKLLVQAKACAAHEAPKILDLVQNIAAPQSPSRLTFDSASHPARRMSVMSQTPIQICSMMNQPPAPQSIPTTSQSIAPPVITEIRLRPAKQIVLPALKFRMLPGDKLSCNSPGITPKTSVDAQKSLETTQNNVEAKQLPTTLTNVQPSSNFVIKDVISLSSCNAPVPAVSNLQASSTTVVDKSPQLVLLRVASIEPPTTTTLVAPAQPVKIFNNSFQSLTALSFTRRLRPWLNDEDKKYTEFIDRMMNNNCYRDLYKCMAPECSYHTKDAVNFESHLSMHKNVQNGLFGRCAYCIFSTMSVQELMRHISIEHKFDVFGCTQCFYRSISPDNVVLHEDMFHLTTGVLIKSNNKVTGKLEFSKGLLDAREARAKFLTSIMCAVCKQKYHYYEFFLQHLKTIHNAADIRYRCNRCHQEADLENLPKHLENCHNIKQFHCLQCPFGCQDMNELRKHFANCHANKMPFFCERSLKMYNHQIPQSSPESIAIQFMGDLSSYNVKVVKRTDGAMKIVI